jgi:hypothetical protein
MTLYSPSTGKVTQCIECRAVRFAVNVVNCHGSRGKRNLVLQLTTGTSLLSIFPASLLIHVSFRHMLLPKLLKGSKSGSHEDRDARLDKKSILVSKGWTFDLHPD